MALVPLASVLFALLVGSVSVEPASLFDSHGHREIPGRRRD